MTKADRGHRTGPRGLVNAPPCALIAALLAMPAPAADEPHYEALFETMRARQATLERYLFGPDRCLGERLDGMLQITADCGEEARRLGAAENADRQSLHALMAHDLGSAADVVGRQRARRNLGRYRHGVLRELRCATGEMTWWDGHPPQPCETRVARLLAHNYARVHAEADATSQVVRDNVQQYEAFGVLGSSTDDAGRLWYQVTTRYVPRIKPPGWSPQPLGWMQAAEVVPWRHALAMRFTSSLGRQPAVFFRSPDDLLGLIKQSAPARETALRRIRRSIRAGLGSAEGVIATEPLVGIAQERRIFYPILDFHARGDRPLVRIEGKFARLLKVAARTRARGDGGVGGGGGDVPIDIVFVMDTTHSMRPYLHKALAATRAFAAESNDDALRFGFIGYQDRHPSFDYQVKPFTLETQPAEQFAATLASVQARPQPLPGDDIPESVFEAVDYALDSAHWRPGAVHMIFLVGDAPGREEAANVRMLRDKAFTRNIALYAFHIEKGPASGTLDRLAQQQYAALASVYQGAYGRSPETTYMTTVDAGAAEWESVLRERFREAVASREAIRAVARGDAADVPQAQPSTMSELIFRQARLLLADDSLPSDEITGWVSDRSLVNTNLQALAPMILLTETELTQLRDRVLELRTIGERALRGQGGTTLDFFDLVQRNTRFTMVDPKAASFRDAFSAPLGLDELPYQSDIMAASRDEFQNMDRVHEFVRRMDNKLAHYEDLLRQRGDPQVWKRMSAGATAADFVVGLELDQLP